MTTYIVEMFDGHKFREEETACIQFFKRNCIPWIPMTLRQMRRTDIFKLKDLYVPIGSIPFMYAAMTKLGIPRPQTNDYPTCFSAKDYGRPIPSIRVFGQISDNEFPLFIKPAEKLKQFTGLVMQDNYNYIASQINPKHKVWTSQVINIIAENQTNQIIADAKTKLTEEANAIKDIAVDTVKQPQE